MRKHCNSSLYKFPDYIPDIESSLRDSLNPFHFFGSQIICASYKIQKVQSSSSHNTFPFCHRLYGVTWTLHSPYQHELWPQCLRYEAWILCQMSNARVGDFSKLTPSGHVLDTQIKSVLLFPQCWSFGHSRNTPKHALYTLGQYWESGDSGHSQNTLGLVNEIVGSG